MTWVLILMTAYIAITVPDYSSREACESAGTAAVTAKNTKIVSYVCVGRG